MSPNTYATPIRQSLKFFSKTLSVFSEEDSTYCPAAGQFTVAQQVAHVAQTIDWFMVGGFSDKGFDLDFAAHQAVVRQEVSLKNALEWLVRAVDAAAAILDEVTQEEMMEPIAAGPIMAGEPRAAVLAAIAEHTAHHRGALAVYARMRGYNPPIPYMD